MIPGMAENLYAFLQKNYIDVRLYSFFIYGNTRTDGGISNNDFVLQLIADITNKSIIRFPSPDMSAIGAALMAGVEKGSVLKKITN